MGGAGGPEEDFDSEEIIECEEEKICIWCRQINPLAPGKQYCTTCKKQCYRECIRCHRPFNHPRYFTQDNHRCNACQKKYLKERHKLCYDSAAASTRGGTKTTQLKMSNYYTSKDLDLSNSSLSESSASPPSKKKSAEVEVLSSNDEPAKKKPKHRQQKKKMIVEDESDETILGHSSKNIAVKQKVKQKTSIPKKRGRPPTASRSIDTKIHAVLSEWLALKSEEAKGESSKIGFIPVFFR